jgi:hypothetical protein
MYCRTGNTSLLFGEEHMSRNSKNARNRALATQFTLLHKKGERGPKRTTPLHGKDPAKRWCHNRDQWYRRNERSKTVNQFRGM